MSPDKQRIAIARARGYKYVVWAYYEGWCDPAGERVASLPDCLNDLNVMHEVEKTLITSDEQIDHWDTMLFWICHRDKTNTFLATSTQRAEAVLKTLNLWED